MLPSRRKNPDETQPTYIMRFRDAEWVTTDSFLYPYAMLVAFAEEMGHDAAWLETVKDEYWEWEAGPGLRGDNVIVGEVIRVRIGSTLKFHAYHGGDPGRAAQLGLAILARATGREH